MTGAGKIVAKMGRRALMWLSAVVLVAGTGALLPLDAMAASAAPMHAQGTLTVDTRGSDVGNCRSNPCHTLGYALTQASPNDTILIRPGTYPESGNANVVPPRLKGLTIRSTAASVTNHASGRHLACDDRRQYRRPQRPGLRHEPPAHGGLPQFGHRRRRLR